MNWIIFTFLGAFFQNLRSSLQKKLNNDLSLIASSYVRFIFAASRDNITQALENIKKMLG